MLSVDGRWVWDFWIADDGDAFHLYYLSAPDSLGHETLRHRNAQNRPRGLDRPRRMVARGKRPGGTRRRRGRRHRLLDRLRRAARGSLDDVLHRQSIPPRRQGRRPTSRPSWPPTPPTSTPGNAAASSVSRADARWYEVMGSSEWPEEAWRDPWVERDGDRWVMYLTARANHGANDDRGVIGYAVSEDLETWHAQPPLSEPGSGFAHLEVPQIVEIDGRWVLALLVPHVGPVTRSQSGRPHRRNLEPAHRRTRQAVRRISGAAASRRVALLGSRRVRQAAPASTARLPLG